LPGETRTGAFIDQQQRRLELPGQLDRLALSLIETSEFIF
jgi:hypothetical protein